MNNATTASAIFKAVFSRTPDFANSFEDRLITQKLIFLLNELGVSCGENSFKWYKHGPYSQHLQNSMLFEACNKHINLEFSDDGLTAIEKIKLMVFTSHSGYTDSQWVEAIGSLLFLRQYIYPTLNDTQLLEKFLELKPHLSNTELNAKAADILKQYKLLSYMCTNF